MKQIRTFTLIAFLMLLLVTNNVFAADNLQKLVPSDSWLYLEMDGKEYKNLMNNVIPKFVPERNLEMFYKYNLRPGKRVVGFDPSDPDEVIKNSGIDFKKKGGFVITDIRFTDDDPKVHFAVLLPIKNEEKFKKLVNSLLKVVLSDRFVFKPIPYKRKMIYIYNSPIYRYEYPDGYNRYSYDYGYNKYDYKYEEKKSISPYDKKKDKPEKKEVPKPKKILDGYDEEIVFYIDSGYFIIADSSDTIKDIIDAKLYNQGINTLGEFTHFEKRMKSKAFNLFVNTSLLEFLPSESRKEYGGIAMSIDFDKDSIDFDSIIKFSENSIFWNSLRKSFSSQIPNPILKYLPAQKRIGLMMTGKLDYAKFIKSFPLGEIVAVTSTYIIPYMFFASMKFGMSDYGGYYGKFNPDELEISEIRSEKTKNSGLSLLVFFKALKNLGNSYNYVYYLPEEDNYKKVSLLTQSDMLLTIDVKNKAYGNKLIREIANMMEYDDDITVTETVIEGKFFYRIEGLFPRKQYYRRNYKAKISDYGYSKSEKVVSEASPYYDSKEKAVSSVSSPDYISKDELKEEVQKPIGEREEKKEITKTVVKKKREVASMTMYLGLCGNVMIMATDKTTLSNLLQNYNESRTTDIYQKISDTKFHNNHRKNFFSYYMSADFLRLLFKNNRLLPAFDFFSGYMKFTKNTLEGNFKLEYR